MPFRISFDMVKVNNTLFENKLWEAKSIQIGNGWIVYTG